MEQITAAGVQLLLVGIGCPKQEAWMGAHADRLNCVTNSVDVGKPFGAESRSGVFCGGRLSAEKGIVPLMRAWPDDAPMLTVAGDGPIQDEVRMAVKHNVRFLGRLEPQRMRAALREALVVAIASVWPEPLPLVALEAFAEGTPVVAFEGWSLGSMLRELSSQCVVTFRDFPALARRACELTTTAHWQSLSERCVELWLSKYSHPVNRESLPSIYEAALALKRSPVRR